MPTFSTKNPLWIALLVVIALAVLAGGYLGLLRALGAPETGGSATPDEEVVILEGTYVCLPRSDGAETRECTPGLQTDDGTYYALDLGIVIGAGGDVQLASGTKIAAGGILIPLEEVLSEQWDVYPVEYVMRVEEIARN